ncbi:hypothetical protein SCOR_14885 [Sulfidibacter corallicola]
MQRKSTWLNLASPKAEARPMPTDGLRKSSNSWATNRPPERWTNGLAAG